MAVAPAAVYVFVRQIHPAGEGGVAVDDGYLPVVPVVVVGGDKGGHGGEHLALYAQFLQALGVVVGQGGKLAGAVVHHPHFQALGGLPGQYLQDPAPHQALVDDEILQKDEMLRLLQLPQQLLPLVLAQGEILHGSVFIDREAAAAPEVTGQGRRARALLSEPLQDLGVLGYVVSGGVYEQPQPLPEYAHAQIAAGVAVQGRTQGGHEGYHQQPGYLGCGVGVGVEKIEAHKGGEDNADQQEMGQVFREPVDKEEKQKQLEQQQEHDEPQAAEHRPHQTLAPFVQKPQAGADLLFLIAYLGFVVHSGSHLSLDR